MLTTLLCAANRLDPFSEGIVFSVRPPKKSWKNVCQRLRIMPAAAAAVDLIAGLKFAASADRATGSCNVSCRVLLVDFQSFRWREDPELIGPGICIASFQANAAILHG